MLDLSASTGAVGGNKGSVTREVMVPGYEAQDTIAL